MFQTLRNAWKITDLRKKILYTLFIVLIFRIGSAITLPFIDVQALQTALNSGEAGDFMQYLTLMSGGGFSNASIFALSITPYINASIIIQLLTVAIPPLEKMAQDGEAGRKKLGQITRYVTVALGLLLGVAYYFMVRNRYNALQHTELEVGWQILIAAVIVLCFTAGSALMMWLGEQINEKGIGNGISILLLAGILSRIPQGATYLFYNIFYQQGWQQLQTGDSGGVWAMIEVVIILVLFVAMIGFIVFITDAERRIPVNYAKRVVGRKMYGGQNTFIPIKVNMSGVMPIILAVSIISLPSIIATFAGKTSQEWPWLSIFQQTSWVYVVLYFILIIAFAFFYVTIQYNPVEMANNLRRNSGAIPGYRPGKPTSDYINRVLHKVTLIGAIFLGIIAVFPSLFGMATNIYGLSLGGTSIMIVVSVALETTQQIESQMMMRHYKGFLE
ncbi:MAG: preprotein translocase subunit SecY [Clostridia bacterium]|nr:preprotein translocase subunit SecY [Clostridia bacterium]